jgi:hypothetical protein
MTSISKHTVKNFWSPWIAGVALGLVLLLTFMLTGHGLGATGASTRLAAAIGLAVAPTVTQSSQYLGPLVEGGKPLSSWITWQVIGVAFGAIVAAFLAGRFRIQLDGANSVGAKRRFANALFGGVFAGFGARVAAGCTSGLGLSGAATLSIAAFVFLGAFFVAGLIANKFARGV